MAPSKNNPQVGFTLIEILIALAILSISLTAIIKVTSENIQNTIYLQDKTIAHWVGLKVMNEVRAGFINLSSQSDSLTDETDMLGSKWTWEAELKPTPNPHVSEIDVNVYRQSNHTKLISLVGFRYATTD